MNKCLILITVFFFIAVAAAGCPPSAEQPQGEPGPAEPQLPGKEAGGAGEAGPQAGNHYDRQGFLAVVYSEMGNLKASIGYNAPVKITSGHFDVNPLLSPDGTKIIFQREARPSPAGQRRFELWLVNIDGTGERRLLAAEDLPGQLGYALDQEEEVMLDRLTQQIAWLSDNRSIAFNTLLESGYGLMSFYDLWRLDTETGIVSRLLEDGAGGSFSFSPDGTKILVANPTAIAIVNADGTGRRVAIEYPFVNTASEYAYSPQPVWSPDGSYGLAAVASEEPFFADPYITVWQLPVMGKAAELSTVPGFNLFNTMSDRLWNSTRSAFAYTDNEHNLHIALLTGESLQVIENGEEFLGWSPDDQHWIYRQGGVIFLAGVDQEAAPLITPEGDHSGWFELKWVSGNAFVVLSGVSYEGLTLWAGEVGQEPRVISSGVNSFDALYQTIDR